jgi:hypothetical protein
MMPLRRLAAATFFSALSIALPAAAQPHGGAANTLTDAEKKAGWILLVIYVCSQVGYAFFGLVLFAIYLAARLAVTPDDLDDAARLVHEVYVARGLRDATARGGVDTERSAVFIARIEGAAGATVSLVSDGPRGLPADALYAPELRALRGRRRTLAEVSGLAVAPSCRGNALALVRPLVQLVGIYARDIERVDDLCARGDLARPGCPPEMTPIVSAPGRTTVVSR